MHSVTLDCNGSPKKRTLSRGLSEDESLRSIIKETESSSRRLTRSDSRAGPQKRRTDSQQSDQDLYMGLPEMLELQASYEEVVQELRGLEVERETLLFQVDVLQDTLESVEELLAEAQREAGQASTELEREREAKKKLESMVFSLMQEMESIKEERTNKASVTVTAPCGSPQMKNNTKESMKSSQLCEPHSDGSQGQVTDKGQKEGAEDQGSVLATVQKMVTKTLNQLPSLAVDYPSGEDGVLRRPYENSVLKGRDPSPDRTDSDSISAYEDASAETPEQDKRFPDQLDNSELPDDSEKSSTKSCLVDGEKTREAKDPDACVVS
ncbi:uncharacterized protein ACO6RY_08557 [Pungitius sinensis]